MHAELHHLGALSLLVVQRQIIFLLAVGDGNDVGGFVNAALEFALVAKRIRIWIYWVDTGVTGLSES